jgi:hypothetical protein
MVDKDTTQIEAGQRMTHLFVMHDPLPRRFFHSKDQQAENDHRQPRQRKRQLGDQKSPPHDALHNDALAKEPAIPVNDEARPENAQ